MEVAVGEYGVDVSKMINAALKKYYEDYAFRLSSNEPVSLNENGKYFFFVQIIEPFSLLNNLIISFYKKFQG